MSRNNTITQSVLPLETFVSSGEIIKILCKKSKWNNEVVLIHYKII